MTYTRGAVVWSGDPFKDDPEAGRPWLVVGNETQPFHDEQRMAVALSTSGHESALPIDDDHWIEGGVPYESYVLPWAVHSPQRRYVDERIGRLDGEFVERVVDELVSYLRS